MLMYNYTFTDVGFLHTFFFLSLFPTSRASFFLFSFFSLLLIYTPASSSSSFYLFIYWAGLFSILFFFLDVIFLWTLFLFFNKFRWLIFLFITFWVLIGYHFFNKGICVNLYKLTFFTPNQTKMREIKIFSILSLFHHFTIFYHFTFSPLQSNGHLQCYLFWLYK